MNVVDKNYYANTKDVIWKLLILTLYSYADYFSSLTDPVLKSVGTLDLAYRNYEGDGSNVQELAKSLSQMSHQIANYIIQGKTTSNTSPDIEFGESKFCFSWNCTLIFVIIILYIWYGKEKEFF